MSNPRLPLIGTAVLLAVLARRGTTQAVATLHLEKIAIYGSSDSAERSAKSASGTQPDNPASLGQVGGAVEGRDGSVFVVDRASFRIVAFDKAGKFIRTFGREGEGPGEFRSASRIAAGADGTLYIWDARLKRLTHFAADGHLLLQYLIPKAATASDMTITNGRVWFAQVVMNSGPGVRAFDLDHANVADSFGILTPQEVSISSSGNPGAITRSGSGDIVFAGPLPLTLRLWSNGTVTTLGDMLRPDAHGSITKDGVHVAPVTVRGVAARPDGSYAIVYGIADSVDPKSGFPVEKFSLALLDHRGHLIGRVALPETGDAPRVTATANGDLLLTMNVDAPEVWRVRLSKTAQ